MEVGRIGTATRSHAPTSKIKKGMLKTGNTWGEREEVRASVSTPSSSLRLLDRERGSWLDHRLAETTFHLESVYI